MFDVRSAQLTDGDTTAKVGAVKGQIGDDDVDRGGRTALHYAALEGDLELVTQLIAEGVAVGRPDKNGWTPLHFAAQGWHLDVALKLIDEGAEVDAVDSFGNSPLMRATYDSRGRGELITMLLERGASPDLSSNSGISPRQLAEMIGNYEVARWFVGR